MVVECNLAVIIFFPKLAEFQIANIGAPFAFSCLANERLASNSGEAVRVFFMIGLSEKGEGGCFSMFLREDFYFGYKGASLWVMLKVV